MTSAIKYIGTADPYFETAVTGKSIRWAPGRVSNVPDTDAVLLMGTGLFEYVEANVGLKAALAAALTAAALTPRKLTAAMEIAEISKVQSGGATQNYTWGQIASAWGAFNAVQLLFANPTASPTTVDDCIIAASANATDKVTPTGSWSAATGLLTIPAGTAASPGLLLTPKIPIRSIPRNDGGRYPLLYSRMYFQAGNTTYTFGNLGPSLAAANWDSRSEGHTIISVSQAGNSVATPGSFSSGGFNTNPFSIPAGYVFTYDYPMITIAGIGDSIMAGQWSTFSYAAPFGFKAVARLNAAGKRVSWVNGGFGAQTIVQINARGKALIDAIAPNVIVIPSWTSNSAAATQADWDTQWYYVMDLAAYQVSKGGQVLILSPFVQNGLTGVNDPFRQVIRSRVLSCGYPYADLESAISDGASPARWKSGLNFDATHPLDAGHEAIADVVQTALLSFGLVG